MKIKNYWAYPGMAVSKALVQTAQSPKLPSANRVIEECCKMFDVSDEEFNGRSRIKKIVLARRYSGFILFHFCGWSYVKLAAFVQRDRTNMMHHVRQLTVDLKVYAEDRDTLFNILETLEMTDTSSSGNNWYYAWVHEQIKKGEYLRIIKHDAADALREIVTITHADGRLDFDPRNKDKREGNLRRMQTVGGYMATMRAIGGSKRLQEEIQAYVSSVSSKDKFDGKINNPYKDY